MVKISACLIAKNEEDNIEKCLNSYKDFVHEIILVDTGSTDNTIEIAKNLGAKVYHYKWNDDFASAKNYALDKATGEWIIFLDADEYFQEESSQSIPNIIKKINNTKHDAIACQIKNIDKKSGKIINSFINIRIFRNNKNIRYKNPIHESLYNKKRKIDVLALYNDIIINHTGYSYGINEKKAERNLKIILKDIEINGDNPDYYRYLSDCYLSLGEYDNAIKYAKLHIKSGIKVIGYKSRAYKNIIDSLYLLKASNQEIEQEIKNAIIEFPDHPNFYCSYAYFLYMQKRYQESLDNFLLSLQLNKKYDGIEANFMEGLIEDIYLKIGIIYDLKNSEDSALTYYYMALKENKYSSQAFNNLIQIIKDQPINDSVTLINSIYNIDYKDDVKFIVDELKKIKCNMILGYYTNVWYKKYNIQDNALIFTLLSNQKYESAFKIFYKGYLNDYSFSNAVFSIISAILTNNEEYIYELSKHVKPTYKRILDSYSKTGTKQFIIEDLNDYLYLLKELVLLDNGAIMNRYIELKKLFPKDVSFEIANILKENRIYEGAIEQYKECLNSNELKSELSGSIYKSIGICYYKLDNDKLALTYLEKAQQKDCQDNELFEFIEWTRYRLQEIKQKN